MSAAPTPTPSLSEVMDVYRMWNPLHKFHEDLGMFLANEDWLHGLCLPQVSLSENLGIPCAPHTSHHMHFLLCPFHFLSTLICARSQMFPSFPRGSFITGWRAY